MTERRILNILKLIEPLLAMSLWSLIYWYRLQNVSSETVDWNELRPTMLLIGFLTAFCFWRWELYRDDRFIPWQRRIVNLLKANMFVFVLFVVLLYFFGERRFSRLSILLYGGVSTLVFIFLRGLVASLINRLHKSGRDLKSIVFCGPDDVFLKLSSNLKSTGGWTIRGWIDDGGLAQKISVPIISKAEILSLPITETVVVAYPANIVESSEAYINEFDRLGLHVKVIPAQRSRVLGLTFHDFFGLPLLTMNASSISSSGLFFKRILDIFGSLFGLILLSPLFLLLGLMTKLSSPGPIFYSQLRVGLDGKRFKLFKFRTMKVGADKQSQWTVEGDSRTTKFGSFLRKTSLDELPQLWNILRGEMSVVGPRPEQPNFVDEFKNEIPNYMLRHRMKAGLTGWAQINGFRGDTDLRKRIDYDLEYIRMWSIWLDIKIILMTFYKGLFSKNAY